MKYIRYLAIILIAVILSQIVTPLTFKVYADIKLDPHSRYDKCNIPEFYYNDKELFNQIQTELPPGTTPTAKGYPLNYRLWHDKRIVVYGSYNSISNSINTFKQGTQNEQGNISQGGYYANGTGEYRYHGFDKLGNKYTNINFINDFKITDPLENNKWLYTPWENDLVIKDQPEMSIYNRSAYRNNTKTQEWISSTAREFEVKNGLKSGGIEASAVENSEKYNFINILTPPTATHPGEGRMWHRTENGTRYQTFSVNAVSKVPTPVTLKMELLTPLEALTIYNTDDAAVQNAVIPVKVRLTAILQDSDYYQNDIERINRYTRYDISSWTFKLIKGGSNEETLTGLSFFENTATVEKTVNYTLSEIRSKGLKDTLYGSAFVTYTDKANSNTAKDSVSVSFLGKKEKELPLMLDLHPDVPPRWYDIVDFPASDKTDLTNVTKRQVFINGIEIDAALFFSGKYIFGESRLGLNEIEMKWHTKDKQEMAAVLYTVIYPTKPNAEYRLSGSYIQNRKMSVVDNSANSNLEFVISKFPIIDYEWSFKELNGSGSLKLKELSRTAKDFLCKKPGTYQIELIVTNSLGRKSDPYILTFIIFEDYPAAVIANLSNSVLARNESITTYAYDVVSTDGDVIASNTLELWYDSDNDDICDQLLQTWTDVSSFPVYTPTKLGKYMFVNKVTEEFGHPTIPEFVSQSDRASITVKREFWVDNYIPMTALYVDIPITRPEIDVFFMIDQNVKKESLDWILNNRMNINNSLRMSNIIAKVENWDLKTYEYSQPASTTRNTGGDSPPGSIYYSSNGYSGTLYLMNSSDNGSNKDFGSFKTRTISKYATATGSGYGYSVYDKNGRLVDSGGSSNSSIYYNDGTYSGTLSQTSFRQTGQDRTDYSDGSYRIDRYYEASYGGTVYGTERYWDPDMRWVSDYTGYYSGTIYKYMIQPYSAPFVATHKKYVIYVTDNRIENSNELNLVRNNNTYDLILIGTEAAKAQTPCSYFILNEGSRVETLINRAIAWIADQNPMPVEELLTLQNKSFTINESDYDEDGDSIIKKEYQYVHHKDYYDNSTGQESGTQTTYNDSTGWTIDEKTSFVNVGLFTVYRRIQDQPTTNPKFANYSYYSNIPYFKVAVHRIPIANPVMTWKYNPSTSLYELTFTDNSYDLDHQYSHPTKGIINTQMRYRKDAGEWNYKMPTDLAWGNYTIEYYVQDVEQAWSNPYVMNITLAQAPPASINIESAVIQKDLRMRSETTIPASEVLQITNPDKSGGPIIRSNVPIDSAEILINSSLVGNLTLTSVTDKLEYIYNSNIFEYNIPPNIADGNMVVTIRAKTNVGNQAKDRNHTLPIYTPIWENYSSGRLSYIASALNGVPTTMELSLTTAHDKLKDFKLITSKYTSKLQVSIGGITYYIFKNGTVGTNISGAGASSELIVNNSSAKYKVCNADVKTSADSREWSFKLSVMKDYPLRLNIPVAMSFTGFDEAGNSATTSNKHNYNPQVKEITPNNYMLYNFRITQVRDLKLESYYKNPSAVLGQPLYIDKPIFAKNMAVDASNFGGVIDGLTKGYKFEFEIDSKNFNEIADTIIIEPYFYTADAFVRDSEERDLYWEDSDHKIYKAGEGGHIPWKIIKLTSADRTARADEEATWRGEYLIPGTAWAVPKGTTKSQAKEKDLRRDIIVSFHIKGYKNGVQQFDYNAEQWGKERTTVKYPYLVGDVIRYSWSKNCLDDITAKDNR